MWTALAVVGGIVLGGVAVWLWFVIGIVRGWRK